MNKFSLLNKLIVQEGKNEEMVDILLEAAESMKDLAECEIYLVNIDENEPNSVYVVIIAVLGVGTWFLLDINRQKHSGPSVRPSDIEVDKKLDNVIPAKAYEKSPNGPTEITIKYAPKDTEQTNSSANTGSVNTLNQNTQNFKGFFVQIGAFGDEASAKEIYDLLQKEGVVSTLLRPDEQLSYPISQFEFKKRTYSKFSQK